ncbi:MAG: hypothetical protein KF780_00465 [Sphingomonas sp.]|nr:hypothetical protein [Sphingomonas sp.]
MRASLIPLAALALAACQGQAPEPHNEAAGTAEATATQNQIEAMPEGQRNAVFIRALLDARQDCQHVDQSVRAGDHEGFPLWSVRCDNGRAYTIAIGNGGEAQIIDNPVAQPGTAPDSGQ